MRPLSDPFLWKYSFAGVIGSVCWLQWTELPGYGSGFSLIGVVRKCAIVREMPSVGSVATLSTLKSFLTLMLIHR